MDSRIDITRIGLGDEERLRRIRLRSLQDAPEAFGSTYLETLERPAEAWTAQLRALPTFVAVRDGADVGVVRGSPDDDASRVWLISLWVAPEVRGQGVGEALVRSVIDWAQTTDAEELLLEVGEHNAHASSLYTRMGFQWTGRRRTLPPPRSHIEEVEMAYRLHGRGGCQRR